jgi:hypothetical protein
MWDELGIPATDDPRVIRKAYAARLRLIGNSADRAALQRLREAYARALALAEGRCAPKHELPVSASPPSRPTAAEKVEFTKPVEADAVLVNQIHSAVAARDIQTALTLYERGLARGTLPVGKHGAILDYILAGPVADVSLDPNIFIGLLKRVGWDDARLGQSVSAVRSTAMSRLEAERWLKELIAIERGVVSISFLLRTTHVTRWIAVLSRRRWERRNARLILVDRPQVPRVLVRSAANLSSLVAQFYHYKNWLGGRISERCVERAESFLAFDKRWGNVVRRLVFISIIGVPLALSAWAPVPAGILGGALIALLVGALLRALLRLVKSIFIWFRELLSV